jgi:hypothetical protein
MPLFLFKLYVPGSKLVVHHGSRLKAFEDQAISRRKEISDLFSDEFSDVPSDIFSDHDTDSGDDTKKKKKKKKK